MVVRALVRGVQRSLQRVRADPPMAAAMRDRRRVDADDLNPIFGERSWSDPGGMRAPEEGFRVDRSMTVQDAGMDTNLIEEVAGSVLGRSSSRELTNVRANTDVLRRPDDYADSAPLVQVDWIDTAQDARGSAMLRRDGDFTDSQVMVEGRGLDTDAPSVRRFSDIFD